MDTIYRLLHFAKEKKSYMVLSLLFSGLATCFSFIPYYFFWQLLKEITGNADRFIIHQHSISIFLTTVLYASTYMASLVFSHLFAFRLETNMKKSGLVHLLNASFTFFDTNPSGRTRKIIDDNSANTHTIIAHMLPDSINAILFPIGVIVLSFLAGWHIGVLVLLAIFFAFICFKYMYAQESMMQEYLKALEDINSETVEYVRGIQVIKVFGLALNSFEKLRKSIEHYANVVNRQCQMCRTPFILYQCGMMSFKALIIVIVYPVLKNHPATEIISLVAFFMTFSGLLNNAFLKIMFFSKNYTFGKDAIDKLEDVFQRMEMNKLMSGTVRQMKNYDIEFKDVSFGYEKDLDVLTNFSLHLQTGKTYAFVGSSGGGKSTIAKLISGFYPIKSGQLTIGGIAIHDYSSDTLERNIAFVFQNAKLFHRSIYENVKMGNPNASYEEVMHALEVSMCTSILDKFDTREQTIIGSKGVYLSGGEIQRIAIARAILKNAPIIILDEASAASDPENEYEMQRAFSSLIKGKTVIMIAHRLSSIRNVDEIIVIDNGKVIEQGSHEELMQKQQKYYQCQRLFAQANQWRVKE